jgi:hypothetical protein
MIAVKSWQRDAVSQPAMQFEARDLNLVLDDHFYFSKEGSSRRRSFSSGRPDSKMNKRYQRWIQFLYGPIFIVIGFFYRIYKSNRDWIEGLKSGDKISFFIRNATLIILAIWLLVWFFAPEGSGDRLVEEVKDTIGGSKTPSE